MATADPFHRAADSVDQGADDREREVPHSRDLLEKRTISIVTFDPAWVGDASKARKIATMAEA